MRRSLLRNQTNVYYTTGNLVKYFQVFPAYQNKFSQLIFAGFKYNWKIENENDIINNLSPVARNYFHK